MKTKLSKTWMPSENVLTLAKSKGMPIEDWLYHLIPEWKLHWLGSGEKRASWDSTFWWWAKSQWEKVDKSRLYCSEIAAKQANPRSPGPSAQGNSYATLSIERFNQQCEDFFK